MGIFLKIILRSKKFLGKSSRNAAGFLKESMVLKPVKIAIKFGIIGTLVALLVFLFMALWALFTTGYLITEGDFDIIDYNDIQNNQQSKGPKPIWDGYDEITEIISRIDMEALKESKLSLTDILGQDQKNYLMPNMTGNGTQAFTWLRLYSLLAEVCGSDMIMKSDAEVKFKPYMLLGIEYHEGGWALGDIEDPYTFWTINVASGTMPAYWGSSERTRVGPYGQNFTFFGERIGPTAPGMGVHHNMTGPFTPFNDIPSAVGFPVLFRSHVEIPNISTADKMMVGRNRASTGNQDGIEMISEEVTNSLVFKQHTKYPWIQATPQRPSGMFIPDVTATVCYYGQVLFEGRDVYSGYKVVGDNSIDVDMTKTYAQGGQDGRQEALLEWINFGNVFEIRAGKQALFQGEGYGMKQLVELDNSIGLHYFWSSQFVVKHGGARKAYDNIDVELYGWDYGHDGTSQLLTSKGGLVSPELVNQMSAVVGNPGGNIENSLQFGDPVRVLAAGNMLYDMTKAVATVCATKFPWTDTDGGGGPTVEGFDANYDLGHNPMDTNFDGKCDSCSGSIFAPASGGCNHVPSKKVLFPMIVPDSAAWTNTSDYGNGRGYNHYAYDMGGNSLGEKNKGSTGTFITYSPGDVITRWVVKSTYRDISVWYGIEARLFYPNRSTPSIVTRYPHMSECIVQLSPERKKSLVITNVPIGTHLGMIGKTGNSSGVHMHLDITTGKNVMPGDTASHSNAINFLSPSTAGANTGGGPYVVFGDKSKGGYSARASSIATPYVEFWRPGEKFSEVAARMGYSVSTIDNSEHNNAGSSGQGGQESNNENMYVDSTNYPSTGGPVDINNVLYLVTRNKPIGGSDAAASVYVPQLTNGSNDIVNADGSTYKVRPDVADKFREMHAAYISERSSDMAATMPVVSGYRSYTKQTALFASSTQDKNQPWFSAREGTSEHQLGLALDVFSTNLMASSKEAEWLRNNCTRFGFIVRYTSANSHITGYAEEPWHLRFVGSEANAIAVTNSGSLETYHGAS